MGGIIKDVCLCTKLKCYMLLPFLIIRDHRPHLHGIVRRLGRVLRPLRYRQPHQHGSVRRYFVNCRLCCHAHCQIQWMVLDFENATWMVARVVFQTVELRGEASISRRKIVIKVQIGLKIKREFESDIIRGTP